MRHDKNKIVHVHDRAFRNAMRDPRVAKDFLSHNMPLDAKAIIDVNTFNLENGSYVDEDLKLLITDVLFSVRYKDKSKTSPAYLYTLLEHLSTQRRLTPLVMVKYVLKVMEDNMDKKTGTFSLVIPIVVYNGKTPYTQPQSIYDLFHKDHQELAKKYTFNQFHLVDLTQVPDEEIRTHQWSVILETMFKHAHTREMINHLESLVQVFSRLAREGADSYILGMLKYYLETTESQDDKRFKDFIHNSLPKPMENKAMTLAEFLEDRGFERGVQTGIQEGVKKGIKEGIQKGISENSRSIAKNLLKLTNNNIEFCIQATGLTYDELEALQEEIA